MFFSNTQTNKTALPESIDSLKSNVQTGVQDWFTGSPAGQTVNNWQNTAQQYGQNMNDWFNQTSLGQNVNQVNSVYDQQMQELQQDERTKGASELTSLYENYFKLLGL